MLVRHLELRLGHLWVTKRDYNQTSGLCDDAWSRGIEWRKDSPSVVPTWLHAKRCCLQRCFCHENPILGEKNNYVFQQDSAPAHTAKYVKEWLGSNMNFWPKDFWPPQSPDLNPLDYSVGTHIESKACKVRHSSVEELKSSVIRSWASMRKDLSAKFARVFDLVWAVTLLLKEVTLNNIIIK